MSLIESLTVKPLLYAVGVLLLACGGLGIWIYVQRVDNHADVVQADSNAQFWRVLYSGCKANTSELSTANTGYQQVVKKLQAALADAQNQTVHVREQSEKAVAEAEAAQADADRTLSTFMTRYAAQAKQTSCAQALNHVEDVCPAFSGY